MRSPSTQADVSFPSLLAKNAGPYILEPPASRGDADQDARVMSGVTQASRCAIVIYDEINYLVAEVG